MEFLADYGMFILKLLTVLIGFLFVALIIIGAAKQRGRGARPQEVELEITYLNNAFKRTAAPLRNALFSKKQRAAERKKIQKEAKIRKKQGLGTRKIAYVINFQGDMRASQVTNLAHTVSSLVNVARPGQEVILKLESAGGFVHTYGLATAQLLRLRKHKLHLTICVDRVAASGGYMMAAVANKIYAAPFSIVGSIGVIGQIPNLNAFLKDKKIDIEQHTAGEYKRTLTVLGKNTPKGRKKFQEDLNTTHRLFKAVVQQYRPKIALRKVATGEIWYGSEAKTLNLIDELLTSDEYLHQKCQQADVYEINVKEKKTLARRLGKMGEDATHRFIEIVISKLFEWRLFRN